jgi:hypothetical protein
VARASNHLGITEAFTADGGNCTSFRYRSFDGHVGPSGEAANFHQKTLRTRAKALAHRDHALRFLDRLRIGTHLRCLAIIDLYPKRSPLGFKYPIIISTWHLLAIIPAGVETPFHQCPLRETSPDLLCRAATKATPSPPSSVDVERHEQPDRAAVSEPWRSNAPLMTRSAQATLETEDRDLGSKLKLNTPAAHQTLLNKSCKRFQWTRPPLSRPRPAPVPPTNLVRLPNRRRAGPQLYYGCEGGLSWSSGSLLALQRPQQVNFSRFTLYADGEEVGAGADPSGMICCLSDQGSDLAWALDNGLLSAERRNYPGHRMEFSSTVFSFC